jgi:hypothetical protein
VPKKYFIMWRKSPPFPFRTLRVSAGQSYDNIIWSAPEAFWTTKAWTLAPSSGEGSKRKCGGKKLKFSPSRDKLVRLDLRPGLRIAVFMRARFRWEGFSSARKGEGRWSADPLHSGQQSHPKSNPRSDLWPFGSTFKLLRIYAGPDADWEHF